MIHIDQISQALVEVARITEPVRVDRIDDQFVFQFDDGVLLELTFDSEHQCLTLMADLGEPQQASRQQLHELLLQYSFLHQRTEGITMCIDCTDDHIWQCLRWPVAGLQIPKLCATIDYFVWKAHRWRSFIADSPSLVPEEIGADILLDEFDHTCAMRV